jgi:hypothetical protein
MTKSNFFICLSLLIRINVVTKINTTSKSPSSDSFNISSPSSPSQKATKIEYDNCIRCKIGNPVVLFNDGVLIQQPVGSEKARTGFMLDIVYGKIQELPFCFYFAVRENKSQWEYDKDEIKKLEANGVPLLQAINIVLAARWFKDIWKGNKPF